MRKYCFSQEFYRCECWALGKTLGFVVLSFLINPRSTPRILLSSGFSQILFFPELFEMHMLSTLKKKKKALVPMDPRPTPRILLESGFATTVFPRDFQVAHVGHFEKPCVL